VAQKTAITESQQEVDALKLADSTGVSDIFAHENYVEITSPFPDIPDPTDIVEDIGFPKVELPDIPLEIGAAPKKPFRNPLNPVNWFNFSGMIERSTGESLYEHMFGYNADDNLPLAYEKMSPMERGVLRAQLNAQNYFTRMALGATKQLTGTLQLVLPESMEQYLVSDTKINEGRLQEDRYYEKRIQNELRKKKESTKLSPEEEQELAYLDDVLPSNWQRLPEFSARITAVVEEYAVARELFQMINVPGGGNLSEHLSEGGKRFLGKTIAGKWLTAKAAGSTGATKVALDALVASIEELGPEAGALFSWGFISTEKGEEGERIGATRLKGAVKITPWAVLPVVLVPTTKGIAATGPGQVSSAFMKRVIAKTVSPIADKLAKMHANKAKRLLIHQGTIEAKDMFQKETGRVMSITETKAVKDILEEVAEQTAKIVREPVDDVIAKMESLAGKEIGARPVGAESIIPKTLRSVETVGDDVINATTSIVEKRTQFATLRQPDGNYAILDKGTLYEVAVGIKRKNLAKELDDLVFGVGEKAPIKHKLDVTKRVKTPRTIVEEVEIKRALKRMEVATNQAFRAGAKDATEKAAIKIAAGKERLQIIKAGNREQWKNVEFARELVKEFVPKQDQHLFMNRLIKAKTEGGLDKIFDDIGAHIDRVSVRNSVDSIRGSLKAAKSKYGDKTGPFAKAPDEIRPILESLNKSVKGITKLSQEAPTDMAGFNELANTMVANLNSALVGKGEVLGIPVGLADDLYSLTAKPGEPLTADNIEALSALTRLVIHRAEQAHLITISGDVVAAQQAIDDSLSRIIPRPPRPTKATLGANIKRLYGVDSDHPITLVERMFGQNSNMSALLDDLYEGETRAFGVMRNSYGILKDYMQNNNIDDHVFTALKKKVTVKIGGKDVKLTRDDVLGLAMSTRDPWVFNNLLKTRGYRIGGHSINRATTDELGEMFALLTPQEMKIGAAIFELNNNYLSQVVNEASLYLNGIKLATYPQYYPSHRALNKTLYGNRWAAMTAETQSNFMPRMGGIGEMRINSYSRELMDYIQNASMYSGTSAPMRSLKTVLASKELQTQLRHSGYGDEMSNFIDILSRSEGLYSDNSVIDAIGSKALNRFTKSVLGGRVSTIGTQIGSVPAAKAVIPSKYFSVADSPIVKNNVDELMSSPFFWYRWTGRRVSIELGDAASGSSLSHFILGKTPLSEKPLTGLIWGDKEAIAGRIYPAAKRYLADTTKMQGDDLTRATIQLTEKATRETQPNWSVLTRSKLASDPSTLKRAVTMFRTAQEAQFNIWKRANVRFARSGGTSKDVAELANSYRAVIESQLSVAIWKVAWKRGRQAGVVGVAGWLGVHAPQNTDPLAEEIVKSTARTVSGIVPLGQVMESAVESAFNKLYRDRYYFNISTDPFSTMVGAAGAAADSVISLYKAKMDTKIEQEGFTSDFLPVSMDEMISAITETESDRKQLEQEISDKVYQTILKSARLSGLVTGLPVGPLDEWIAPGFRRSKFALVRRIDGNNSTNPANLQRDLDKFLTLQAELTEKEEKKGLTQDEAFAAFNMKIFKGTYIDTAFAVDDTAGDEGDVVLDSIEKPLAEFLKRQN